jgi:hypothetical protein
VGADQPRKAAEPAPRWQRAAVYPFAIAIYPILYLWAQNVRELDPADLVLPASIAVGSVVALWGLLALRMDGARAGLMATVLYILFITVESAPAGVNQALTGLTGLWVRQQVHVPPALVVVLEILGTCALGLLIVWGPAAHRWVPHWNLFALVLILQPLGTVLPAWGRRPHNAPGDSPHALAVLQRPARRPDIYYIILDGFARADVLRELYGYDLDPFLARLERRGFYVARESTSNYCQTPLSLASSLNGRYLEQRDSVQFPAPVHYFHHNAVIASLRPLGYRFATFSTGFDFTDDPEADFYLSPFAARGAFHQLLIESTPLRHLVRAQAERDSYAMSRERTLYLLKTLPEVARIPGPTFTVAHILSPHPPFLFGPDGADVSRHEVRYRLDDGDSFRRYYDVPATSFVEGYRAQVAFLARRVESVIEQILARSPEPPVIILQSDHGPGLGLNVTSAERTDHWERMSILNAYYFPKSRNAGLNPTVTPVNTFRILFNNEFGTHLALLPEESYYSPWDAPFDFTRVTAAARRRSARETSQRSTGAGERKTGDGAEKEVVGQ